MLACSRTPAFDPIPCDRVDRAAIRCEGEVSQRPVVARIHGATGGKVPEKDRVVAAHGQRLAVRREGEEGGTVAAHLNLTEPFARRDAPESDSSLAVAGGQCLAIRGESD